MGETSKSRVADLENGQFQLMDLFDRGVIGRHQSRSQKGRAHLALFLDSVLGMA